MSAQKEHVAEKKPVKVKSLPKASNSVRSARTASSAYVRAARPPAARGGR